MYGVSLSSPSRTIALCPAYWATTLWSLVLSALGTSAAFRRPRLYSAFVMAANCFEPSWLNWRVTIGWPVFWSTSAAMADSFSSVPVISGIGWFGLAESLKRYQYLPLCEVP